MGGELDAAGNPEQPHTGLLARYPAPAGRPSTTHCPPAHLSQRHASAAVVGHVEVRSTLGI
jgi:hypothetical protein